MVEGSNVLVELADVLVDGWASRDTEVKKSCKSLNDICTVRSGDMTTGPFCFDLRSKKRLARNRKSWAAMRTPVEANTFPVSSGWKKINEELPGTELTGAKIEIPKVKGSLGN